ncbi:hypothetical protein QBD01_001492 [Ochrobactrum sp. 19YEA23]|uniref:2OG-Fe(II) oxygenase n=1 Tax=Ochrobactrum sp. 19YEA23 TaxID=3039854 RepID=UPI002479EC97|nr:hypothetical protein [Ochrobactrum sp. 19YEA23]
MKTQLDPSPFDGLLKASAARIAQYPWDQIAGNLDTYGAAVLPGLLSSDDCTCVADLFSDTSLVRVPAVEEQQRWGNGNYRYMRYPLPEKVSSLRTVLYPYLVPIANGWNERMDIGERYPFDHETYLETCYRSGQTIPTSMMLDHSVGQQTLLHQDVYGEKAFPLQTVIMLSQRGADFNGGEFVITEQRPRMQTRPEVVTLNKGDALVFATSNRPVNGTRGMYRVNLRHGFSQVREGKQRVLSIIFHDAAK